MNSFPGERIAWLSVGQNYWISTKVQDLQVLIGWCEQPYLNRISALYRLLQNISHLPRWISWMLWTSRREGIRWQEGLASWSSATRVITSWAARTRQRSSFWIHEGGWNGGENNRAEDQNPWPKHEVHWVEQVHKLCLPKYAVCQWLRRTVSPSDQNSFVVSHTLLSSQSELITPISFASIVS